MEFSKNLNYYLREKNKIDILILILSVLNPFIYLVSPIALAIVAVIEVILILCSKEELYLKFWKGLLVGMTFYGVTIFHIKIYYWIFLLSLPFIIYKYIHRLRGIRLWFTVAYGIYIVYLGIILVINPIKGYTVAEYIRYLMCFAILFITLVSFESINDVKKIFGTFRVVAIANIISGVLLTIFALTKFGGIVSGAKLSIVAISIFLSTDNFRVASFFTDPNLYYSFFIFLLVIYEFIKFREKEVKAPFLDFTNIILIIPVVLSFSRTAMLLIGIYIVIKFITVYAFKRNIKTNNIIAIVVVVVGLIIFVFFSQAILDAFNWLVYNFTVMIGRKEALVYSSSFTDSSRMLSWKVAIGSLKDHWIFGRGLNYWQEIYYMPPHNSFIMILQSAGIVGLLYFVSLLVFSIRKIPIFISLIIIIAPMFTLDLQDFSILAMLMAIGIIAIDSKFTNYSKKIKYFD